MVRRYDDESGGRVYEDKSDGVVVPSVTRILDGLDTDETGLQIWRERNDGKGDAAFHEHLFWYKQHRGTLAHSAALSELTADPLWGEDEQSSLKEIQRHADDIDRIYSVAKDHNSGAFTGVPDDVCVDSRGDLPRFRDEYRSNGPATLVDLHWDDVQFVVESFRDVCKQGGITPDSVLSVEEKFVQKNDDAVPSYGFGGQLDLAYEDPDGNTVVADLKTSSSCRAKHRLQVAAYGEALYPDYDRLEVIRIHPDSREYSVHSPEEYTDLHTSDLGWDGVWTENYDVLWTKFEQLAKVHPMNAATFDVSV
jgi:hypothetical protein